MNNNPKVYKTLVRKKIIQVVEEEEFITLNEYIHKVISHHSKLHNLTRKELGELCNISPSTFTYIETGNISGRPYSPNLATLESIAFGLGIHITDLLPPKIPGNEVTPKLRLGTLESKVFEEQEDIEDDTK